MFIDVPDPQPCVDPPAIVAKAIPDPQPCEVAPPLPLGIEWPRQQSNCPGGVCQAPQQTPTPPFFRWRR